MSNREIVIDISKLNGTAVYNALQNTFKNFIAEYIESGDFFEISAQGNDITLSFIDRTGKHIWITASWMVGELDPRYLICQYMRLPIENGESGYRWSETSIEIAGCKMIFHLDCEWKAFSKDIMHKLYENLASIAAPEKEETE